MNKRVNTGEVVAAFKNGCFVTKEKNPLTHKQVYNVYKLENQIYKKIAGDITSQTEAEGFAKTYLGFFL